MNEKQAQILRKLLRRKEVKTSLRAMRILYGSMRFRIVLLLAAQKEGLNVTELAKILGASLSRVSHQLRILKVGGFVAIKGKNRETLYTLRDRRTVDCLREHHNIRPR